MSLPKTRPTNPVLLEFSQKKYTGLDTDVIEPIRKPLEHAKQIDRFWNDDYVKASERYPSLYDHIIGGLDIAKDQIFKGLNNVKKLSKEFNRAWLVHDFGEMMMEFSTFYGRYNKTQKTGKQDFDRAKTERSIADMVFRSIKVFGGKSFIEIFTEASEQLKKTTGYDKKLAKAKSLAEDIIDRLSFKKSFPNYHKKVKKFSDDWMHYFDMSQKEKNKKNGFIANLVKVVDKLEGHITGLKIHGSKVTKDFSRGMVLNYMKAFRSFKEAKETKEAKRGSAKKQVFDQVDRIIRAQFEEDNAQLGKRTKFKDFNEAYQESYSLTA